LVPLTVTVASETPERNDAMLVVGISNVSVAWLLAGPLTASAVATVPMGSLLCAVTVTPPETTFVDQVEAEAGDPLSVFSIVRPIATEHFVLPDGEVGDFVGAFVGELVGVGGLVGGAGGRAGGKEPPVGLPGGLTFGDFGAVLGAVVDFGAVLGAVVGLSFPRRPFASPPNKPEPPGKRLGRLGFRPSRDGRDPNGLPPGKKFVRFGFRPPSPGRGGKPPLLLKILASGLLVLWHAMSPTAQSGFKATLGFKAATRSALIARRVFPALCRFKRNI